MARPNPVRIPLFVLLLTLPVQCRTETASSPTAPKASKGSEASEGDRPQPKAASTQVGAPSGPAPSDSEPIRDIWYDFTFKGQKVGYLHARDEPTVYEGEPALHVLRSSVLEVTRLSQRVRMESSIQAWARKDGTPLEFLHRRQEGGQVRQIRGRRVPEGFEIVTTVGGRDSREVHPLEPGTVLASTMDALWFSDLDPSFEKKGMAISESEGDIQPFQVEVTGEEDGRFVVKQVHAGVTSLSYVAPGGTVERTEIPAMGASFVVAPRDQALKLGEAVDLFSAGLFSVPQALPPRQEIVELQVRVGTRSGAEPPALEDVRQKARSSGSEAVLTLTWSPEPEGQTRRPVQEPELAPYLEATAYEDLKDPALVAAAEKAVDGAPDVWTAAQRLNRFVNRTIERKTLARAFNSASEALQSKEGDCTEHAVLFSALAKISGIPTRLATGLVYVGGVRNQFGYHEWVEVWTDGRWHPMDPTFGQVRADPTHIKFAVGQSDPDGLRQSGKVAASLIGDLELEVLAYRTRDGRTVKIP